MANAEDPLGQWKSVKADGKTIFFSDDPDTSLNMSWACLPLEVRARVLYEHYPKGFVVVRDENGNYAHKPRE